MDLNTIIQNWAPTALTIVTVIAIFYLVRLILNRQSKGKHDLSIFRSTTLILLGIAGLITILLSLPMSESVKGQVINLIGIVISAVIALSSATLIGNALAGIMLRMINNYKAGDFIQMDGVFGRVTERGLFHTEVQTETRDLMTLPNMYLATNPVRVIRTSGTFIEGVVSLGYDVNHNKIKEALINAATNAELEDPFVRVNSLGDYSVVYKVYGLLKDAKLIITAQSRLNSSILDALHDAGIEIVSPTFMNQRDVSASIFIPKKVKQKEEIVEDQSVEGKIFDKAEQAESIENRKETVAEIDARIKDLEAEIKAGGENGDVSALKEKLEKLKIFRENMIDNINFKEEKIREK